MSQRVKDLQVRRPTPSRSGRVAYWTREAAELAMVAVGAALVVSLLHLPRWWVVVLPLGKAAVSVIFYALFLRHALGRSIRNGVDHLIGRAAVTATVLRPAGRIRIDGETWAARSVEDRIVTAGQSVRIVAIGADGVLWVTDRPDIWNPREAR